MTKRNIVLEYYDQWVLEKITIKEISNRTSVDEKYVYEALNIQKNKDEVKEQPGWIYKSEAEETPFEDQIKDFDLNDCIDQVTTTKMISRVEELPGGKVQHLFQSTMNL